MCGVGLEARRLHHRFGRGFGDAADVDFGARGARAFGDGIGHLLDMPIARIIEHQNLSHHHVLFVEEKGEGWAASWGGAWKDGGGGKGVYGRVDMGGRRLLKKK